jgi:hypothetical protein
MGIYWGINYEKNEDSDIIKLSGDLAITLWDCAERVRQQVTVTRTIPLTLTLSPFSAGGGSASGMTGGEGTSKFMEKFREIQEHTT